MPQFVKTFLVALVIALALVVAFGYASYRYTLKHSKKF